MVDKYRSIDAEYKFNSTIFKRFTLASENTEQDFNPFCPAQARNIDSYDWLAYISHTSYIVSSGNAVT